MSAVWASQGKQLAAFSYLIQFCSIYRNKQILLTREYSKTFIEHILYIRHSGHSRVLISMGYTSITNTKGSMTEGTRTRFLSHVTARVLHSHLQLHSSLRGHHGHHHPFGLVIVYSQLHKGTRSTEEAYPFSGPEGAHSSGKETASPRRELRSPFQTFSSADSPSNEHTRSPWGKVLPGFMDCPSAGWFLGSVLLNRGPPPSLQLPGSCKAGVHHPPQNDSLTHQHILIDFI